MTWNSVGRMRTRLRIRPRSALVVAHTAGASGRRPLQGSACEFALRLAKTGVFLRGTPGSAFPTGCLRICPTVCENKGDLAVASGGGFPRIPLGKNPSTFPLTAQKNTPRLSSGSISLCWHCPIFPVRRQTSIFGTGELNCRVRNGNGWTLTAKSTNYGTPSGTRTLDTLIKSQVLYQLS